MWFEVCEVRQSIEDDPEYTRNDRKYVKLLHPPLEIQCIIKSNGIRLHRTWIPRFGGFEVFFREAERGCS